MSRWAEKTLVSIPIILAVISTAVPAAAGYGPASPGAEQACSEEAPDCLPDDSALAGPGAFAGKPVSLFSGAETFTRTDLTLGSLYPIVIQRRYNSRSAYDSQLGYGWALNHDRRLYTYPDGSVIIRKECGWKRRFTLSGGTYITPPGETGTLVKNVDGTFTYTFKEGSKENYDTHGRLSSLVDAKGNSLVFTYEAAVRSPLWGLSPYNLDQSNSLIVSYDYRIARIEEKDSPGAPTGNSVTFSYDYSTGRLNTISDSLSRTVTYGHDSFGNLTAVTSPGAIASYIYATPAGLHSLTSIDEGQGAYTNVYDSQGRVVQQTHDAGIIDIAYLEANKKTKVTTTVKDNAGTVLNTNTRTVEFDTNGQIAKETDTFGNVTQYTRSGTWITREEYYENTGTVSAPNLVLRTANNYTYDSKGNMLTRTEAQGTTIEKTTTWTYHPVISLVTTETVTSVVNPAQNRVITNLYNDNNGNLLTTTETGLLGDGTPYMYTTTYDYYPNGKLKTIDGPRTDVQDVTTYYYDPITGFLNGINQPVVGTTTYTDPDLLGNPRTVTDPNGNATTYTYDDIGRVLTVKAPGDTAATQYAYVSAGCTSCGGGAASKIDHITLPEGNTIWYTYDTMGNLITIKDSLNNTINYTRDSEGNRLTEDIRDAGGVLQKALSYQYDALNRLKKTINPDSTYAEYGYDFRGNRNSLRTPNSSLTTYSYDALNRLIAVIQPGNITTSYTYDTNNNLTSVKDTNNNTTTYKFDDKGRVYQTISPDTGTTTYGYDPAGNMISKTDAKGVTITYSYDAANRLTRIHFPSDPDIVYAYDSCVNGKGRLCSMTDASGTTNYEWTPKGQVKKETKTIDSVQYVTQYAYDQNGNLKTMTYPSGRVITYNVTSDRVTGVLNNAANLATNINYKPFGGMTSITYGNGIVGSIGYDNQYRITGIQAPGIMNLSYNLYDANGNIKSIQNILDPTKNKSYDYDSLDRLGSGTGPWGNLSWTYDGVGNRLTENSNSYTYFANSNKLNSANAKSFGYDNNGNTTTEGSRQYIYNQNQRLIQVNDGAMTANYTYNGNGQRVKKTVNGTSTIFHYNQAGQPIAESNVTGVITAEYVYLNGVPLAKVDSSGVNYIHTDHIGTPVVMTDAAGTKVWEIETRPFGDVATINGSATLNLRFPGQYHDEETGLNYNWHRYDDTKVNRFIEADPVGIQESENHLYVYAKNNPLNNIDKLGLFSYNTEDDSITGRLPDSTGAMVSWLEMCLGINLVVTGGWENGHKGGALGPHGRGEAADFSFAKNPQLRGMKDKFMCCAKRVGFNFAQYEPAPPHYHVQIGTGDGGATGDLPNCCKKPECCK